MFDKSLYVEQTWCSLEDLFDECKMAFPIAPSPRTDSRVVSASRWAFAKFLTQKSHSSRSISTHSLSWCNNKKHARTRPRDKIAWHRWGSELHLSTYPHVHVNKLIKSHNQHASRLPGVVLFLGSLWVASTSGFQLPHVNLPTTRPRAASLSPNFARRHGHKTCVDVRNRGLVGRHGLSMSSQTETSAAAWDKAAWMKVA